MAIARSPLFYRYIFQGDRKALIKTNVEIDPDPDNGLTKKSIADCLPTRPIDKQKILVKIRGFVNKEIMTQSDRSLKIVFELN